MTKFLNKTARTFWGKALNVLLTLILMIGVCFLATKLIYPTLYATEQSDFMQMWYSYKHPFLVSLVETVFMAPLIEEVMFRHFPLTFVKKISSKLTIPMIYFSSIIFGLMHYGYPSLFLQGVLGFLFCVLYIKNGYSYWSSVTAHALYNLAVILVL